MLWFWYFGRYEETPDNRLLLLWRKAAVMLDCGNKILRYHKSWDWWCFKLLYGFVYCTVLMWAVLTDGRWKFAAIYCNTWDVTTWHIAAERLRTFYTLQNACQQHCKHYSDSGEHLTWLPVIALEVITVCVLKIGFVKHNLLLWFFGGDMCTWQCVIWFSSLCYIS